MRRLAETEVLKSAAIAAAAGAVACYPNLALWPKRTLPLWYLEAVLLFGGIVLWAFVFAWHTKYSGRPVFNFKLEMVPFLLATGAGILAAVMLYFFFDPTFRAWAPEDYPTNFQQWIAMTLFSLGFTQLFLVFAPFAWALRLSKNRWIAIVFTALFGVCVVIAKIRSSPAPITFPVFFTLLIVRGGTSLLFVWFYSRYGVMLSWWWGFLVQARQLFDVADGS
jgi:hypothetical protein